MRPRTRPLTPTVAGRLTLRSDPWLSCDDCFRLVDEYVERVLAGEAEPMPAMAVHLEACPACAEEAETLLALAADDLGPAPRVALPDLHREVRPLD